MAAHAEGCRGEGRRVAAECDRGQGCPTVRERDRSGRRAAARCGHLYCRRERHRRAKANRCGRRHDRGRGRGLVHGLSQRCRAAAGQEVSVSRVGGTDRMRAGV